MFSDPVVGSLFFGREEILETLKKRIDAFRDGYRQNLALIGEERLGKTSIVYQYLHSLHDRSVLPVYVDLTHQSLETFIHHFCRTLLFQALVGAQAADDAVAVANWDALMLRAESVCPRTVAQIKVTLSSLQAGETEKAYSLVFELTTQIYRETGRRCVVILDEFHRLGDFPIRQAFQVFGKRLMIQKETQYILLSSSVNLAREILAQKLALLFGHFERIDLSTFDFKTADQFIRKHLEPAVLDEPTTRFLIAMTDGHPFYLNVLTQRLREETERQFTGKVTRAMVLSAFKRLLFDAEGILNQCFVKRVARWTDVRSRGSHRQILLEVAAGAYRLQDLAARIGRSQAECSRQLADLTLDELIVKNGSFYTFTDKLFQFWLKAAYRHRDLSLVLDAPSRASLFIKDLDDTMSRFWEADRMSPAQRLTGLLSAFAGDRVDWEGKVRQLPVLKNAILSEPDVQPACVTASSESLVWECRVFSRPVTEADVRRLETLVRVPIKKRPKIMLVHVSGMDPNAKLLAKNLKILVVSLHRMNLLLDLHQLPKLVWVPESMTAERIGPAAVPVRA